MTGEPFIYLLEWNNPEGRVYRFVPAQESVRLALLRKRRMRLIYKWRHGLPHSHQPAHRDRGKLRFLELFG